MKFAGSIAMVVLALTLGGCAAGGQSDNAPRHAAKPSTSGYRRVWSKQLDNIADSAPTIVPNVKLKNGKKAVVAYVLAGNNSGDCDPSNPVKSSTIYAYVITGTLLWKASTSGQSRCTTSAPAFWNGWVFIPGLDGKIHKYNAATGSQWKHDGWPINYTKQPYVEKASAALEVSGPYLYLTTSGFDGDQGHYEGHVVTVDLKTNHVNVWNSLCSNIKALINNTPGTPDYCPDVQAGMFGRGEAVIEPLNKDVYVVTGNGPWNGKTDWGDSVLELNPQGNKLIDAFTPTDQATLNSEDLDLGSTSPAILPPVTDDGKTWYLMTQGGKGGAIDGGPTVIWLLNRKHLGSKAGPGSLGGQLDFIDSPGGREVLTKPAVWVNPTTHKPIVIYANDSGVTAYSINTSGSTPKLAVAWSFSGGATSPVVAGNTLFLATDGSLGTFNPANGNQTWGSQSSGSGGTIAGVHWNYPAVYGKWVLMTDTQDMLYAYEKDS